MRVIIIEDEELASARLERMILHYDKKIDVLAKMESIEESVEWLQSNDAPDLIFLDIHLEDGLSFEIFESIEVKSPIIFTTAFDEYAIKAFKLKSIDYLLKPIVQEELNNAIRKYSEFVSLGKKESDFDISALYDLIKNKGAAEPVEYKNRFAVQIGQKIKSFPINDVAYFYSENSITFMVTLGKAKYPIDESLDKLENQLDPNDFFRVNRSHIVKISAISNVSVYPKSRLKLELTPQSDKELFVSSEKSTKFREWLDK